MTPTLAQAASIMGKKGGPLGGRARMALLSPAERVDLAKKAAAARQAADAAAGKSTKRKKPKRK